MNLDYETTSPEELEEAVRGLHSLDQNFRMSGEKYELHKRVLKPKLEIFEGAKIVEIGVGDGFHLSSYKNLDYHGFDADFKILMEAMRNARAFKIPSTRIQCISPYEIPLEDKSVDRLFLICALHEVDNIDKILQEIDRLTKPSGIIAIIERMCAIEEIPKHITNLKKEPALLPLWFSNHGYATQDEMFRAFYWGESLTLPPQFNFYLFLARKN